jgi:hypothetical protein
MQWGYKECTQNFCKKTFHKIFTLEIKKRDITMDIRKLGHENKRYMEMAQDHA